MNRKLLALAMAAALTLAACGSDDKKSSDSGTPAATPTTDATAPADTTAPSGGASSGSDLKLSADPSGQLKFDTDTLDAKAGTVTLTMSNPADVPHAIAVEGNGVDKDGETVQKGGTSTITVKLKAGDYEFYCPVPGHKEGGMKGTLTVK